jgi:hypothetical protein
MTTPTGSVTPYDLLNGVLYKYPGVTSTVNSVIDLLPDSISNQILSSVPTQMLSTLGANAFNNPIVNNPVTQTILRTVAPKAPAVGTARRGANNAIELYAGPYGDINGWVATDDYAKKYNNKLPARMNGNPNPDVPLIVQTPPKITPDKSASTNPPGSNNPSLPGFNSDIQGKIAYNSTTGTNIRNETKDASLDIPGILAKDRADRLADREARFRMWSAASADARQQAADLTQRKTEREQILANIDFQKATAVKEIEARALMNQALMTVIVASQTPNPNTMAQAVRGNAVGVSAFSS